MTDNKIPSAATLTQQFTQAIEDTMHSGRGEKCTEIAIDFAVEFAEWTMQKAYPTGVTNERWKLIGGNLYYTTRELISLFLEEKKIKEK